MNNLKQTILIASSLIMIGGGTAIVHASTTENQDKTLLCHETESQTNPFVVQSVSANEVKSHEANGDFVYGGAVDDKGKPTDENWCVNHQPSDVCPNIDGLQTEVPNGDELINGDCVPVIAPPVTTNTPTITSPTVTAPAEVPGFNGKN